MAGLKGNSVLPFFLFPHSILVSIPLPVPTRGTNAQLLSEKLGDQANDTITYLSTYVPTELVGRWSKKIRSPDPARDLNLDLCCVFRTRPQNLTIRPTGPIETMLVFIKNPIRR